MADTFEYSGDHEWVLWREGVMCAVCDMNDRTQTVAIGVNYSVYGDAITGLGEIHATPVCEDHADRNVIHSNVIRFVKEDN